ncbi:hypothetical protein [Salinifilum aidingensis]
MMFRRCNWWLAKDVWDVVRAVSPTHLHLRNRLGKALLATLIVDIAGSGAMLLAEGDAPSTALHSFGDALYWTTSQLTTLSSTMPNPITGSGQVICVIINVYAITVVSTLAGMFGAFFHRRGEERDPLRGHTSN